MCGLKLQFIEQHVDGTEEYGIEIGEDVLKVQILNNKIMSTSLRSAKDHKFYITKYRNLRKLKKINKYG